MFPDSGRKPRAAIDDGRSRVMTMGAPEGRLFRLGLTLCVTLGLALCLLPGSALAKKGKEKKRGKDLGEVVGRVIDQTGAPLEGARVVASEVAEQGGETEDPTPGEVVGEETTDKGGNFELRFSKPVGSYFFQIFKQGYRGFEGTIAVSPGLRQEVEFRLIDESLGRRRDAGIAYNEGVAAFNKGELTMARAKFEKAVEMDPDLLQASLGLADVYYREGEDEKAAVAVERYLASKSEDLQALRLAYSIHRRRDDEERLRGLLDSIRGTPLARNVAIASYNEGVAAQGSDAPEAIALFQSALDIDPSLSEARLGLASLHFNSGDFEPALQTINELLEIDPGNPQGRRILFLIQNGRGDLAVEEAFESYFEVEPDAALDLLFRRADLDFRDGRLAPAKKALERILEERPEHAEANYTLGLCYASSDNKGKAKEYLRKFLTLAPNHPEAAAAKEMISYF